MSQSRSGGGALSGGFPKPSFLASVDDHVLHHVISPKAPMPMKAIVMRSLAPRRRSVDRFVVSPAAPATFRKLRRSSGSISAPFVTLRAVTAVNHGRFSGAAEAPPVGHELDRLVERIL